MKGRMFVVSGPSGVGKGTIVEKLIRDNPQLHLSVSATTRGMRSGEAEGINYYYKTREEFAKMIEADELLEWAEFCGNYYGTPKAAISSKLDEGKDVILEIETQGAMKVKECFPESIFVFVVPPSMEELENRLKGRDTEKEDVIKLRVDTAKKEIQLINKYDYVIVNDNLDEAVASLEGVIAADRLKTDRAINDLEVLR